MPPPPPKKVGPPPPVSLPASERVKVVRDGSGYKIVTSVMGLIVGPRLWKGQATYPDCETSGLTLQEAKLSFALWDRFTQHKNKK